MYNGVYILNWYQKQPLQKKFTPVPLRVSPNQGSCRPIRARLAGQWEAGLKNIWIIWISGRRRGGGIVWVNPSSKCASCHSYEMQQRIIHTHVNVSSKAYVYDDTIYNFCAWARFAGCTHMRNIILALNTVCMCGIVRNLSSKFVT